MFFLVRQVAILNKKEALNGCFLSSLVADLSPELAAMLLAVVIGGYTLIGGLGATFYVSYFNTALIFFLIILLMVEVGVIIRYI